MSLRHLKNSKEAFCCYKAWKENPKLRQKVDEAIKKGQFFDQYGTPLYWAATCYRVDYDLWTPIVSSRHKMSEDKNGYLKRDCRTKEELAHEKETNNKI